MKVELSNSEEYSSLIVRCVSCGGRVRLGQGAFSCIDCGKEWAVKDGVPVLTESQYHYHLLTGDGYSRLVSLAEEIGWKEALDSTSINFNKHVRREFLYYLDEDKKPYWKFLLPLSRDSKVLDLGCGWGVFSVDLAKSYRQIVAMDASFGRIKLLNLRKLQDGIQNLITICGGNMKYLPFPHAYFDLVVMNGVLEWVATSREGDPQRVQEDTLKETCKVLRPGGILYLGIENRFGYEFLLGHRDPHTGLRWGNVMPRSVANLYSKLVRGEEFREYTQSYWGLKRMFESAGFTKIEFYTPYRHYNHFERFFPLDDPVILKRWVSLLEDARRSRAKRRRLLFNLMARFGVFKFFAYHFGVIATR